MQLITGIIGGILGLLFINFNKEIVTKVHWLKLGYGVEYSIRCFKFKIFT
jgi:hypothetical protein